MTELAMPAEMCDLSALRVCPVLQSKNEKQNKNPI